MKIYSDIPHANLCLERSDSEIRGGENITGLVPGFHVHSDCISLDSEPLSLGGLRRFVESRTIVDPLGLCALKSFFKVRETLRAEQIDDTYVRYWIARMAHSGTRQSTIKRYYQKIQALYSDFAAERPSVYNPLAALRSLVDYIEPSSGVAADNLKITRSVINCGISLPAADRELFNAFLYLLSDPTASMTDVVDLTRDASVSPLVGKPLGPANRKYYFSLGQGRKRQPQILRELSSGLNRVLTSLGMNFPKGFSRDSITEIWIEAALAADVPMDCVAALPPRIPSGASFLSVFSPMELGSEDCEEIISATAATLDGSRPNWYVARLLNGSTPDDFRRALPETLTAEFFYPTHTVARKADKKIIKREEPYLRDILFVRAPQNRVSQMFRAVSTIASGFRTGSVYSIIPPTEMARFQRHIGMLTPDMELELITRPMLQVGRRVRITGGIMDGYEGIIYDITPDEKAFVMTLTTGCALKWTARLSDLNLLPLD